MTKPKHEIITTMALTINYLFEKRKQRIRADTWKITGKDGVFVVELVQGTFSGFECGIEQGIVDEHGFLFTKAASCFQTPPTIDTNRINQHSFTIQVGLLLVNSILILNRQRFLSKHGLDDLPGMGGDQSSNPLKAQMVSLLFAVQYLKPVVIVANTITILFELILGGT